MKPLAAKGAEREARAVPLFCEESCVICDAICGAFRHLTPVNEVAKYFSARRLQEQCAYKTQKLGIP